MSKREFNLWTPIPWLITLVVVLIVGAVSYLTPDDEVGKRTEGPVEHAPKMGQEYHHGDTPDPDDPFGLFAPHEEDQDLAWNCLMHGNKSC